MRLYPNKPVNAGSLQVHEKYNLFLFFKFIFYAGKVNEGLYFVAFLSTNFQLGEFSAYQYHLI